MQKKTATAKEVKSMTRMPRLTALALALTLTFAMLFSAFFILGEADHDCVGENCHICFQLSVCENTLRTVGRILFAVLAAAMAILLAAVLPSGSDEHARRFSPVSLKVKLSD